MFPKGWNLLQMREPGTKYPPPTTPIIKSNNFYTRGE